jgi:lipopolysaccharide export system protein LptA
MQAFVDSPVTSGKVPFDQQMCYQDGEFTVYADKANLEYSIVDDALQPVSLTMRGNVRLRSQEEESPPRAAIADRVNYSPATRTLILTANPGKRVLFWDQQQAMRISATEVHVTYDAESGKESVKGVGNVKFAFTAEESDKLQKYFPLYSISQKTEQ